MVQELCGIGIVCGTGMGGRKAITGECCHLFPHKAFLVGIFAAVHCVFAKFCTAKQSFCTTSIQSFAHHSKVSHMVQSACTKMQSFALQFKVFARQTKVLHSIGKFLQSKARFLHCFLITCMHYIEITGNYCHLS